MRNLLIKILFKLLGIPSFSFQKEDSIETKRLNKWKADIYATSEFNRYIQRYNMDILQVMGNGLSRDAYLMSVGQRSCLGVIMGDFKKAFLRKEKEQKTKQKNK